MLKYTIPIPPVSKKNSQQILINRNTGKPFVMPSKQYKDYEAKAIWYFRPPPTKPIDYPVNVKCLFYMPTHRRVDKSNLENCVMDVLVRAGVLADDNRDIVAGTDGSRVFCDAKNPRTEIYIEEMEGYDQWAKRKNE